LVDLKPDFENLIFSQLAAPPLWGPAPRRHAPTLPSQHGRVPFYCFSRGLEAGALFSIDRSIIQIDFPPAPAAARRPAAPNGDQRDDDSKR
jgi:hypothetical protein